MADYRETKLKAGEVLFTQGENPEGLYLLESGALEILSAADEYNGLNKSIVLSKSVRVGTIRGKTYIVGFSEGLTKAYRKSVRAFEDSSLKRYPLANGGIKVLANSDPGQAITIVKCLNQIVTNCGAAEGRFGKLYQNVCMMTDNIAIMYRSMSETNTYASLHSRADSIFTKFRSSGGREPSQFDARFLVADNSVLLKKRYEIPTGVTDAHGAKKGQDFLERMMSLDAKMLLPMVKADTSIIVSMYDMQSEDLMRIFSRIESLQKTMSDILNLLFGSNQSWSSYLVDRGGLEEWRRSRKLSSDFVQGFLSLIAKINTVYEEMFGKKIITTYPIIKKIHEYYSSGKDTTVQPGIVEKSVAAPAVISSGTMAKSLSQIFEFAVIDKEFQSRFIKLLNEFKKMKDPFDTEIEGRKIRRHIAKMYWDIYKQAFIRTKTESVIPRPVQLMIRFGFVDENLIEREQLNELNELIRIQEHTQEIPVAYESEFLSLLLDGKVEPSITEMGLTYEEYLRDMEKVSTKKSTEVKSKDERINMVLYEIGQRVTSTAAVCSGSTATAFPILTSLAVKGSLKNLYISKRFIESLAQEMRETDFSLFYRETVFKLGEARELIMEEIIPYFIMIPILGAKTLLWQELSGTNRRSRGRIVVPIFFMGDIKKRLIHSFACFRWELNRSLKGAMWADPIEGGVTGEFFDYVNTYKKMSKLSQEAKEKISERFKALRTNRDRFADDYIQWILYEKEGIMRQNAVVREMFFKHIPFRKSIREKLEAMPAFTHAAGRYKNVLVRSIQAYERRFKKYQKADGSYPDEIQKFFEFLNL